MPQDDQLDKIGIPTSKQGVLLDVAFGKDGLVESEDKKDLKMKMEVAYSVLDPYEKAITGSENAKFSTYLRKREKTVLRKLIRDSRRKALKTDAKIPPRLYTNQSESVNLILAAKKSALGFNKKDDVRLSCFVQSIWKEVVDHQSLETGKAICNQSNKFRLADHAKYLAVSIEDWYNMSRNSQESYVREFRNMK